MTGRGVRVWQEEERKLYASCETLSKTGATEPERSRVELIAPFGYGAKRKECCLKGTARGRGVLLFSTGFSDWAGQGL